MDEFTSKSDWHPQRSPSDSPVGAERGLQRGSELGSPHEDLVREDRSAGDSAPRETIYIDGGPHNDSPPRSATARLHPLDRPDEEARLPDEARIKLAWAKLIWLLSFLAVLLAISYLVPYIAENTQYAITRGRQRAEHDFAREHLGGSPLSEMSRAYQMVSQVVGPSVVHINTQGSPADLFPLAATRRPRMMAEGQGSGIIVDSSGYILTNNHVVSSARHITVSLADGRKVAAELVGADRETDLAVLKVQADKLTPAAWGNSDDMQVGALVWAVGSPFGLERSITSGILSAKNRSGMAGGEQAPYQDYLQSDAAVNPGNSGGPLVNAQGEVIGINTAIVGEVYQGISFAIPSNLARDIFERIKREGLVRRGWLGVQLAELADVGSANPGLQGLQGVYIMDLFREQDASPAERAGILPGDVILRWNGTAVARMADLRRLVAQTEIGSTAVVVVHREGQDLSLEVVVGERPTLPSSQ